VLHVHRALGTAALADGLAELLQDPLADPFQAEVVAVPAKGVERWLTQRLATALGAGAREDGVAANIAFPSPTRLVEQVLSAVSGIAPEDDPWAPERLLWTVLDVVDDCLDEPWCAVLHRHLDGERRVGRRHATAEHLSRLFRDYGAHRPDLLVDWSEGRLDDVPPDLAWQAQLWRAVRDRLGPSPAERLAPACAAVRERPELLELPTRLSVFGPTRLTTEQLVVLAALAEHRDVHLWLPHPSPALWHRLTGSGAVLRADDRSVELVEHPLLASLSRDVRELQQRLSPVAHEDHLHPVEPAADTLLGTLQADLAADRVPSATALDHTVQVHSCHGPARQVEVLREVLLHLFDDDPTLEPRDVLVMCPDVETFAPLVRAAFGQGVAGGHPGHRLRVRLADRSLRQTNPLLDTLSVLLDLADGRVTASQVLDLAAHPGVRRKFSFDEDELEQLRQWATDSGVRWGLGQPQREAFGLGDLRSNTWGTGLDRVLLGVAADESSLEWLSTSLPLDDVDSGDIDLAGRLAELVDRLRSVLARLHGTMRAPVWVEHLTTALDWLTEVSASDGWQLAQAQRELATATQHAGQAQLRLADVRSLLRSRLAGRPTRANFRTGELTVCTMVPMRSVPHRAVVLLGLDDGLFPRPAGIDGDDLLSRQPHLGERDPRSEDRQLLLDAVMSAGERLVVLYTGADPVSGQPVPPAVPLGELLDVVRTMTGSDPTTRHPLQPFDARNFQGARPFSFDADALTAARTSLGERRPVPFLLAGLPAPEVADVELPDLVAFVQHPVKALLSQRLGVWVSDVEEPPSDVLHTDLEPLELYRIGDRWLTAVLAGAEVGAVRQAEWRRGSLPPGHLGSAVLSELEQTVRHLAGAADAFRPVPARRLDVSVDLGDGRRLTGTVAGIHGDVLLSTSFSRLGARQRLAAWVRLLALAAAHEGPWRAVTIGRGRSSRVTAQQSVLSVPAELLAVLRDLVLLRDEGLVTPLPVAEKATAAYAAKRLSGTPQQALDAARAAFGGDYGDRIDRQLTYVHGDALDLSDLLVEADPDEGARFGALARRIWEPLLAAESVGPA
jgi:exodeoxyribonuclease V gamma subunit